MVSFLDVAHVANKTVLVRGVNMPVFGISGRGIVSLFNRFPEIREKWANRKEGEDGGGLFTAEDMQSLAPRAINAIIAAGIGKPGDEEQEAIIDTISAGEQGELLIEILEATFPRGLRPFASKLRELGLSGLADSLTSLLDLKRLDIGKAPDTTSPPQSNGASPTDIPMPGTTPPSSSEAGSSLSSASA